MDNRKMKIAKRIVAILLVFAMMMPSLGDTVEGIFRPVAKAEQAEASESNSPESQEGSIPEAEDDFSRESQAQEASSPAGDIAQDLSLLPDADSGVSPSENPENGDPGLSDAQNATESAVLSVTAEGTGTEPAAGTNPEPTDTGDTDLKQGEAGEPGQTQDDVDESAQKQDDTKEPDQNPDGTGEPGQTQDDAEKPEEKNEEADNTEDQKEETGETEESKDKADDAGEKEEAGDSGEQPGDAEEREVNEVNSEKVGNAEENQGEEENPEKNQGEAGNAEEDQGEGENTDEQEDEEGESGEKQNGADEPDVKSDEAEETEGKEAEAGESTEKQEETEIPDGKQDEANSAENSESSSEEDAGLTKGAPVTLGMLRSDGDDSGTGSGSGTTRGSDDDMTALEKLVEDALNQAVSESGNNTLTGTIQVILAKNTNYGSESVITAGNRKVAEDFVLELSAEDAGEDGTKGEGYTVVTDDLYIKGIRVIMNSVVMADGKTVHVESAGTTTTDNDNRNRGGGLEYNAVTSRANKLNVSVGENSSAELNFSSTADTITVSADQGAKSVTVNAGGGFDTINATVTSGDMYITTGSDKDTVNLNIVGAASGGTNTAPAIGEVRVDTGAGDDTLYVMDNGAARDPLKETATVVDAASGEPVGDDFQGETATVQVKTGGILISSGSGDDVIKLDVRANAGAMTVDTGEGGDAIEVYKGDQQRDETVNYHVNYSPYETANKSASAVITLQNSDENAVDRYTIDVSAARAIKEITMQGGKGASVNLRGVLRPETENPIESVGEASSRKGIRLHTQFDLEATGPENDYTLEITAEDATRFAGNYNFTDKLANKKTVFLYAGKVDGEYSPDYVYSGSLEDFTDYVFATPVNLVRNITVNPAGVTRPLLLTNVVLDTEQTSDTMDYASGGNDNMSDREDEGLIVNNITAPNLNVLLKGKTIDIKGHIIAQNVWAESVQGTKSIMEAVTDNLYAKPYNTNKSAVGNAGLIDMVADMFSIYDNAVITVKKGAKIETAHDIALVSKVKQWGGLFALAAAVNAVNLKIATADVTVEDGAELQAGKKIGDTNADGSTVTEETAGTVYADARTDSLLGYLMIYQETVDAQQSKAGLPVGLNFVINDASVNIDAGSKVAATEDILLKARDDVSVYNYADASGALAIALTFINSEVKTKVAGDLEAGRKVFLDAAGVIKDDTEASKTPEANGATNIYGALNVVNQNVDAVIKRGATVIAHRGDVAVYSTAVADVTTKAVAGEDKQPLKNVPDLLGSHIVGLLTTLTAPLGDWVGELLEKRASKKDPSYYSKKIDKMLKKVGMGNYEIKLITPDEENAEAGEATVSVKVAKEGDEEGHAFGVVEITPKTGKGVKSVEYRFLESTGEGASAVPNTYYTYKKAERDDKGNYIFLLDHEDTTYEVIVTYCELSEAPYVLNGAIVNKDELEDVYDLSQLFDEGPGAMAQDAAANDDPDEEMAGFVVVEDPSVDKISLTFPVNSMSVSNTGGRILTWQTVKEESETAGTTYKSLSMVHAGQVIRFVGNPGPASEGKKKKLDSITITYNKKDPNTGTPIATTVVITADDHGQFLFTVPDDLVTSGKSATGIKVTACKFEEVTDEDGTGPAHNQTTGSLGVAIVLNKGNATIESSGIDEDVLRLTTVSAGGKVDLYGYEKTNSTTVADGRAVVEKKPGANNAKDEGENEPTETSVVKWTVPGADFALKASSTLDGAVTGVTHKEQGATSSHPEFTYTPPTGQGTGDTTTTASYNAAAKTITLADGRIIDLAKSRIIISYYTKLNVGLSTGKMTRDEYSMTEQKDTAGFDTVSIAEDGTITFKPQFATKPIKEGTTVDVSFIFTDTDGNVLTDEGQGASSYAITNPINIRYNALTEDDSPSNVNASASIRYIGKVEYYNQVTDGNGKTTYYFVVDQDNVDITVPQNQVSDKIKGYVLKYDKAHAGDTLYSDTDTLYASWVGADGLVHKQALKYESAQAFTGSNPNATVWSFTADDDVSQYAIPAGSTITINAVFTPDKRDVKVNWGDTSEEIEEAQKQGTVEFKKKTAMSGETVEITMEPKDPDKYGVVGVTARVYGAAEGSANYGAKTYYPDQSGKIKVTVPEYTSDSQYLIITPVFAERTVNVLPDESEHNISISISKAYPGETVTVSPNEASLQEGKKISELYYSIDGENWIEAGSLSTITIPYTDTLAGSQNVRIQAVLTDRGHNISNCKIEGEHGKIQAELGRADKGDEVILKVSPDKGYRAKYGTVRVAIQTTEGEKKITASWVKDNTYKFKFDWDGGEYIDNGITLFGEFEEGDDGIARSLGVAIALGIAKTENNAEIEGGQISAERGVELTAISSGKASTEAKAGYSKAKKGIAGAIAFQVSVGETQSIIHQSELTKLTEKDLQELHDNKTIISEDPSVALTQPYGEGTMPWVHIGDQSVPIDRYDYLHIGSGQLSLYAKSGQTYNVTADAANKKNVEASGTGVGAGLAVGIDARDTIAEVEDGIQLDRYDVYKPSRIDGISVTADQKVKDTITAVAGAAGGTSFVPVAAIDVYNTDVRAQMGKFDLSAGRNYVNGKGKNYQQTEEEKRLMDDMLTVGGAVKIKASGKSAEVQYNHAITADASSRGGGSAIGAAFIVTWISNDVDAILNQSVYTAKDVSVTSQGSEALKAVATAAATGGSKGKSGSADKQANSMLGAAGNIAGKVGAADNGKIKGDIAGRQLAETGESSVAGAGAFVLNMMKNYSTAEINDGVNVHTLGKLTVVSKNRTDATIKANASTAKSDKGVGVAVALNIVFMDNIARIGNGEITANELELAAKIATGIAEARTYNLIENETKFRSQLSMKLEEILKDLMGEKVYKTIGSAITTFASTFADQLIADLNLRQVFELVNSDLAETCKDFLNTFKERLMEFPMTLLAPYKTLFDQMADTVTGWDKERVWNTFEDIWTSAIIQSLGDGLDTARSVLQRSLMSLIGAPLDMITDGLQGKGWDFSTITKKLEETAKEILSQTFKKIIDNSIKRLSQEFPVITESNVALVKQLKDLSLEKITSNIIPYFTKIIRDEIYDYEPVATKIREKGGIKDYLKSEIKSLLATSTAAMTNEMIQNVVGSLNVKFTREPVADRHIITTQAISGSSAKNSTTSGAISVAVANLTTKAEIADSDKPITVDGNMDVEAEELRRIRTHASASVNSRNPDDPDNNEGAGETEDDDVGGDDAGTTSVTKTIKHKISAEDFEILEKEKQAEKGEDPKEKEEEKEIKLIPDDEDDDDDDLLPDDYDRSDNITIEKILKEEEERKKEDALFYPEPEEHYVLRDGPSFRESQLTETEKLLIEMERKNKENAGLLSSRGSEEPVTTGTTETEEVSGPVLRDGGINELDADFEYNDFDTARMNLGRGIEGSFTEDEDSDEITFAVKEGYKIKISGDDAAAGKDLDKIHINRTYTKSDKSTCSDTITAYKGADGKYHCNFRDGISSSDQAYIMMHEKIITLDIQIDDITDDYDSEIMFEDLKLAKKVDDLKKLTGNKDVSDVESEDGVDILEEDEIKAIKNDPKSSEKLRESIASIESGSNISVSARGENGMPKDMQEIKVKALEGFTVYGFTIVTKEGEELRYHPEFGKDDDWEGMVVASSNEEEVNYGIKVPKEGIEEIKVVYERISVVDDDGEVENDGGEKARKVSSSEQKASKDSSGKTVGRGGSFALTWGDSDVTARIGTRNANRTDDNGGKIADITAGTLNIQASSDHEEENFSTAGTDPYEGVEIKDAGTDVAVSFNMLDNHVTAEVASGTMIRTTATEDAAEESNETGNADEEDDEEDDGHEQDDIEIEKTAGDLIIRSHETSENETKASAFATGSTSAKGASVAINVSKSDIRTEMGGEADVIGDAYIRSYSRSQDRTWAYASAMGADVQRLINKLAEATDSLEDAADKLSDGTTYDDMARKNDRSKNTETSNRMADRLNDKDVQRDGGEGGEAAGNMAVSTNAMRSQNAQLDGGEDMDDAEDEEDKKGSGKAEELIKKKTGMQDNVVGKKGQENKKQQLAATVGVTVALHDAAVKIGGTVKAGGDISITSQNAGNFNTRSSSFSITLARMDKGSSIAAAFGVSVNNNKSTIDIGDQGKPAKDDDPGKPEQVANLISTGGNVTVDADLTQNMTGTYRGWLAVQSLSGAVSGREAEKTFAGAVSVVVSHATTRAALNNAEKIEGNDVSIRANDKSKLAARAGGISISKGTNTGMGVSIVTIWAGNDVEASLNKNLSKNITVKANSFDMRAVKEKVDYGDFTFPLNMGTLITDSSELTDEQRENVYTGFIDVHKEPGKKSYTIDVNIDSYALMQAADALNFLSSNNYYAESIAGSVTGKSEKTDSTNRAGSISIVRASNTINTILGNNITIQRKDTDNKEYGPVNVIAQGDTTARILAGSMAAGSAASTAGVTVTFLYDRDNIDARIGQNFKVVEGGNVNLKARGKTEVENYNGAAGISVSDQETGSTLGGAVNLMILETTTDVLMGSGADIDAKGKLNIRAKTDMDLKLVSVSASAAFGQGTSTGGTVAFINDLAKARVVMGSNHNLKANDDVSITAEANDFLMSITASASGAAKGRSLAGSVNILHAGTEASVVGGAGDGQILSRGGSITVKGHTDTKAVNVTAGIAVSGYNKAIGLSINLNFFDRASNVDLKAGTGYRIEAKKDILISARGSDTTGMGALAAAGGSDFMLAGNVAAVVSENYVNTRIGYGNVKAGGEIAISSHLRDLTVSVSGAVALSLRNNAMGGTYMLVHKENTVTTDLGATTIHAEGAAGTLAEKVSGLKKGAFKGLYIGATVNDSIVAVAVGAAAGFKGGVTANVLNINNINRVKVKGASSTLKAKSKDGLGEGSVTVRAKNDSSILEFSGGLNASAGLALGAAATTLYSYKYVKASVNNIEADRDIDTEANNHEKITALNINVGGGKDAAVEVGISVQVLESKVLAVAYGDVRAETGSLKLHSHNDTDFVNATVAAGGSVQAAVSPVVIVTVFAGSSEAQLYGANVYARNDVNVIATSNKNIDTFAIGAAAGKAAVSGAVTVTTVKDTTKAVISNKVTNLQAENMNILSESDYDLFGLSATVSGGIKAAVAVNTMLSFVKASTLAEMEGKAVLHGGKATVTASSHRDVVNLGATLSGVLMGAGVGITVSGLAAGSKMDQDAADMVVYGKLNKKDDEEEEDNNKKTRGEEEEEEQQDEITFDEAGFRADLDNRLKGTRNTGFSQTLEERKDKDGNVIYTSLASDMQGNGNYVADTDAGKDGSFDASSGTVSDEFYEERQKADKTDSDGENEDDTRYMHDRNENMGYGQDHTFSETDDIAATRELGHSVYDDIPSDSVIARIGADASITGYGVEVLAAQGTEADIIGGTIASGGVTGVGASAAFAVLHSNVSASNEGTLDVNDNGISVKAYSVAGSVESQTADTVKKSTRDSKSADLTGIYGDANKYNEKDNTNAINSGVKSGNRTDSSKALGNETPSMDAEERKDNEQKDVTVNQRTLSVVGLAVASGFISGAAAVSVLRTDNVTQAQAGGTMKNVGTLDVSARADYDEILAVTLGGSMGQGGAVAASVGVITAEGTVDARINSTAVISGKGAKVDVFSEGNIHGMSFAATAALGGYYSGAAGASVVANRLTQKASIERGAKLTMTDRTQPGYVKVHSKSDTSADSYLIGIASGTFNAAGLGVAVAIVKPTVHSTIGVEGTTGMTTLGNVGAVSITNEVDSEANTGVLSVAVAQIGASLSGNVLVVLNNTDAVAKAANSIGSMRTLTIKGDLSAEGDSKFLALQVGMAATGASLSYVDVSSTNKAVLDLDAFTATISDSLKVATGEDTSRKTKALALSIAAQVAKGTSLMANVAIALNNAKNISIISGKAPLNAPKTDLIALSDATSRTRMYGLNLTMGVNVGASVSVTKNQGTSLAQMQLNGGLNGDLNVKSKTTGTTKSYMLTGSGSLVGLNVNVAASYGKTNSIIDVDIAKGSTKKNAVITVNADNTKNDDEVKNDINNLNLSAYSANVMVGAAYAQDVYSTKVKIGGNYTLKDFSAKTDYTSHSSAKVTPSKGGVKLGLVDLYGNAALAKNTVWAGTEAEFTGGTVNIVGVTDPETLKTTGGNLTVETKGKVTTDSEIRTTAFFQFTGVSGGLNWSESNLSAKQAAVLTLNKAKVTAREITVESLSDGIKANANIGSLGINEADRDKVEGDGLRIDLVRIGVNRAFAQENLDSSAIIRGKDKTNDQLTANKLQLNTANVNGTVNEAYSRTDNGAVFNIVSGGAMLSQALMTDNYHTTMEGVKATVKGLAQVTAKTNSYARAMGMEPGGFSAIEVNYSEMKAYMGDADDRQTAKVVIGDNTELITEGDGNNIVLLAQNNGEVKSSWDGGHKLGILNVAVSKAPTGSWYDTGILIGSGSTIQSGGKNTILSETNSKASSLIDAGQIGLIVNVDVMRGKNNIDDENRVNVGSGSTIQAKDDLMLKASSNTNAQATSDFAGGSIVFSGSFIYAKNFVNRDVRVNLDRDTTVKSTAGATTVASVTGENDWIYTMAQTDSAALIDGGYAKTTAEITSNNEVNVGAHARVESQKDLKIIALATEKRATGVDSPDDSNRDSKNAGVYSYAWCDIGGMDILGAAYTETTIDATTLISFNRNTASAYDLSNLKSNGGNVLLHASNEGMRVRGQARGRSIGAFGGVGAYSDLTANIGNTVWIDNTMVGGTDVKFLAGDEKDYPFLSAYTKAKGYSLGKSAARTNMKGTFYSQVRSIDPAMVNVDGAGKFTHIAYDPKTYVTTDSYADSDGIGVDEDKVNWEWRYNRCDFCAKGTGVTIDFNKENLGEALKAALKKALVPLNDIERQVNDVLKGITKARYGEEDYTMASKIFALALPALLDDDATLETDQLMKFKLWTNARTHEDVYLLPNSTRMYGLTQNGRIKMDYVVETFHGDLLDTGIGHDVDVINALTGFAYMNPVIPVGSTGSLDFRTGILTLPDLADFELYLDEVSAAWLTEKIEEGFLRAIIADQDAVNSCALNGASLPEGTISTGLTADGEMKTGSEEEGNLQHWKKYWLGDTPETAADYNQTLIYLLVNEKTDEVDAFRTSRSMIASGESPVDVSLYLYRDTGADWVEEEKYNILFFDTPKGERSLVKAVANVLTGNELETPLPLRIVLRRQYVADTGTMVFSMTGHQFVMLDASNGGASLPGHGYGNRFDGDVFESDYIRIEGIRNGNLKVTFKAYQPVWAELLDADTAEDLNGKTYVLINGVWYPEEEAPVQSSNGDQDAA